MADTGTKDLRSDLAPTDALKDAGQQLLGLLVQRAAQAATERVTGEIHDSEVVKTHEEALEEEREADEDTTSAETEGEDVSAEAPDRGEAG